ncbi:hypothetical protein G6F56_000354 [Rhizopus delemar]|nr:hypothetical protein G6F56_000354 [Rhizopus delemar]
MNGADLTQNEFWEQLMRFQTEVAKNDEARANGETPKDESSNRRKPTYIAKAEAEKIKGNEFFVKKDFHKAKQFYTSAIEINPTVSVYYVNRSMTLLKLKDYMAAERDATKGIELDSKSTKGYWRRSNALQNLGRLDEAKRDLNTALKLEPNNKAISADLKKLEATQFEKEHKLVEKKAAEQQKRLIPINVINRAFDIEELKSTTKKKPAKKENVPSPSTSSSIKKDVSTDVASSNSLNNTHTSSIHTSNTPKNSMLTNDKPVNNTPAKTVPTNHTPVKETPVKEVPVIIKRTNNTPVNDILTLSKPASNTPTLAKPKNNAPIEDIPTIIKPTKEAPVFTEPSSAKSNFLDFAVSHDEPKKEPLAGDEPFLFRQSSPKKTPKIEIIDSSAPKEIVKEDVASEPVKALSFKFSVPRTNFEFERDWKTCKARGDDLLYQYFQNIPPSSFSQLFKSSLESKYFEDMIQILSTQYAQKNTPQDIFNVLEGLSGVKRLDMLVMFLSKKQEQDLKALFEKAKLSNVATDKLANIAKKYTIRI